MKKLLAISILCGLLSQTASAQYYDDGYRYEPYGEDLYYPPRYNRRVPQSNVEILEEGPIIRLQKPKKQRDVTTPQPLQKPTALNLKNTPTKQVSNPVQLVNNPQYMPQEIVFEFTSEATPQAIDQIIAANKLERIASWKFKLTNSIIFQYRIKDGRSVEAVMTALVQNKDILSVYPNYIYNLQPKKMGLNSQAMLDAMHVKEAQSFSKGTDVVVSSAGSLRTDILSVSPEAKIITQDGFTPQKNATGFQLLRNLDWAFENKAKIVTIGFAGTYDKSMRRMIAAAKSQNMIVIEQSSDDLKVSVTAGVVALMLQLKPDLNIDDVGKLLAQSAKITKMSDGKTLKLVDVLAAVKAVGSQ